MSYTSELNKSLEAEGVKPCPFCGKMELEEETYSYKSVIYCANPKCEMEVCTNWQPNRDKAIELWNKRELKD